MATTRPFVCDDLLSFNAVNLDVLTETYNMNFYCEYMSKWPGLFKFQESSGQRPMSYFLGKAEGRGKLWHGHVSAVTVNPEFRRIGLANSLMGELERISRDIYNGYFVDLFVRVSNTLAINMYKQFGYVVYRRVLGYYSGSEDAFDMRKALPRDASKESEVPLGRDVRPEELERWTQ